ncbi:MAG: CBS domain-containing protein [Limnothrix sp.]
MLTSLNSTLAIAPAIGQQFLTGTMAMTLAEALSEMVRLRSHCDLSKYEESVFHTPSCLVVVQDGKLCGTFTERDLIGLIAEGADLDEVTLGEAIRIPAVSLTYSPEEDIFTALDLLRHYRIRHLPIIDEQERPVGMVTYDSLRSALPPINLLTRLHCVADVMVRDVVVAPLDASLLDVSKLIADHQVSCVVICKSESIGNGDRPVPVGIVTERDIIQFQSLALNLTQIQADEVMSSPLFTLSPESSLWEAHETMNRQCVRRLVVLGRAGEMRGIVSQTSLFQVLRPGDMYQMIGLLHNLIDERSQELAQKNNQLQQEIYERHRAEVQLQQAHDHLKALVEERTQQLQEANAQLQQDLSKRERMTAELEQALRELQETQLQLIQTEKMSGLGQLVAGIAHEINNPINFIYGNLQHAGEYVEQIIETLSLYEKYYPEIPKEIRRHRDNIDLDFLKDDVKQLITSMYSGVNRIRNLLLSLRTFSRLDESALKMADLHKGLDSTLLLIQNRLQGHHNLQHIQVIREYEAIPQIECYPGQLNQVFLNLLLNAIDAVQEAQAKTLDGVNGNGLAHHHFDANREFARRPQIRIKTHVSPEGDRLIISIRDNGPGISDEVQQKLFDPFFTTKPVGKGTGLGLSISYQIVVGNHGGQLECHSDPQRGTEFVISLPVTKLAIAA